MALPGLITALALILYLVTIVNVGRARAKYKIKPPATTGNEQFERVFRVQQNTMEQLVLFLPSLWMNAVFFNPLMASLLGAVWLVGRAIYIRSYSRPTGNRMPGFIIGMSATFLLLLSALAIILYGLIRSLF